MYGTSLFAGGILYYMNKKCSSMPYTSTYVIILASMHVLVPKMLDVNEVWCTIQYLGRGWNRKGLRGQGAVVRRVSKPTQSLESPPSELVSCWVRSAGVRG